MKRIILQILILMGLAVVAGFATKEFHPYAPAMYLVVSPAGEGEVLADDALIWHRKELVVWIDARKLERYEKRHAPEAFLLNEYDFDEQLFEIYADLANLSDKRFIVYCDAEDCKASHVIADALRDRGFQEVYVLKGGWRALEPALDKANL